MLLNNGDGTFQYAAIVGLGGLPGSFTLGDFNHDGKIDLAEIGCDNPDAGYPFGYASCTLNIGLGDNNLLRSRNPSSWPGLPTTCSLPISMATATSTSFLSVAAWA